MYLCIYLLAYMYITFMQCLRRPEEGVWSLELELQMDEPPYGCWEPTPSLQEQPVLWDTEMWIYSVDITGHRGTWEGRTAPWVRNMPPSCDGVPPRSSGETFARSGPMQSPRECPWTGSLCRQPWRDLWKAHGSISLVLPLDRIALCSLGWRQTHSPSAPASQPLQFPARLCFKWFLCGL